MPGLNPILTCREVVDLLADDLDRSMPISVDFRFRLHMLLCRSCRRFRRTYRQSVNIVRALRAAEDRFEQGTLPDELVRRIVLRRQTALIGGGASQDERETTSES